MTDTAPDGVSESSPPHDEVASLEYDSTIPPRPEEVVADAVRATEERGRHLSG